MDFNLDKAGLGLKDAKNVVDRFSVAVGHMGERVRANRPGKEW